MKSTEELVNLGQMRMNSTSLSSIGALLDTFRRRTDNLALQYYVADW